MTFLSCAIAKNLIDDTQVVLATPCVMYLTKVYFIDPVTSMSRPPSLTSLAYSAACLISLVTMTYLSTTIDLSTSLNSMVKGSMMGP